jgi:hypothetical protein
MRRVLYWLSTILLAIWLLLGAGYDLSHAGAILRTLGYPDYLNNILGVAKLLAVPALFYPRWPTLREWAYAGVTFDGLGAFFSHVAVHDTAISTIAPLVFLGIAATSYFFRSAASSTAEPGSQPAQQ